MEIRRHANFEPNAIEAAELAIRRNVAIAVSGRLSIHALASRDEHSVVSVVHSTLRKSFADALLSQPIKIQEHYDGYEVVYSLTAMVLTLDEYVAGINAAYQQGLLDYSRRFPTLK